MLRTTCAAFFTTFSLALPVWATDLEVTHWWTSGSEAAAVRVLADKFNATGHNWVDGAIAGAGGVARPLITSRITGGDPMGATQFTHGRAMGELIEAGFMRDFTDLAEREGWRDLIFPSTLLDDCTFEDRIYCVPSNTHSQQWLWLSTEAFATAGVKVPTSWTEFVAAAPTLREHGIVPLATGRQPWQMQLIFNALMISVGGPDVFNRVYGDKDAEFAGGPEVAIVFAAADDARHMIVGSNVQEWNLAAQMLIDGKAAGQIMGDWVQGEFVHAGLTIGTDIVCLAGMGEHQYLTAAGDAFFFPKVNDPSIQEAQEALASIILQPVTQVEFNLAKGSLPVRRDVELHNVTPCMQAGMGILNSGQIVSSANSLLSPDTIAQITDLMVEFFNDTSFPVEQAQEEFAAIVRTAD
ncbi:ABC transporter substrate-binding protein [Pelagibacterium limicola]|uniref:ABC transporter substrate-binding protein n=1 Tax=Pelagibacterium limicola TaxID=2791022 RepID=UPI0018AF63E6|nr:ABC transporter substrate-binding protein [Pelagibacterium limicola]